MNELEEKLLRARAEYYNYILPPEKEILPENLEKVIQAKKEEKDAKYLDWERVCIIIKQCAPQEIVVGLKEDWEATHDIVYKDYKWVQTERGDYWCNSIWDTPRILVYTDDINAPVEILPWTYLPDFTDEAYEGDNTEIIQYYKTHCDIRKKEYQDEPYKLEHPQNIFELGGHKTQ